MSDKKKIKITVTPEIEGAEIEVHLTRLMPYEAIGLLHHAIRVIENAEN